MVMLTQATLKKLLHYETETGVFTWQSPHQKVRVGDVAGHVDSSGYRRIGIGGKMYKAHRLAWLYKHGEWPKFDLDHLNGTKDDNRIANLREAKSQSEQMQNATLRSDNTSGFPGVYWHKQNGKWAAAIGLNGKRLHVGLFDDLEDAAFSYLEAKKHLHAFNPEVRGVCYQPAERSVIGGQK